MSNGGNMTRFDMMCHKVFSGGRRMNIGDTFSWSPSAFEGSNGINETGRKRYTVSGRVTYVNAEHRYFTAEAEVNGYKLRESFKF